MMTLKEIDERILHYEDELKQSIGLIKRVDKKLAKNKVEENIQFLKIQKMKIEFFSFVTTSYIDILCTYKNLKRAKTEWEKFYNIRIAYLIAYETINTYHKYKGEIYKTVNSQDKDFYKQFFDMLNRELTDFKDTYQYDKVMPKIRNKSVAHYDRDFVEYYSSLRLIDNTTSNDIIRNFLYFINPLHYFTYGLIKGEIDQFLFINSWMT